MTLKDILISGKLTISEGGGGGGGGSSVETGVYVGEGTGIIKRRVTTSKKYDHFLIVAASTYSQLTSDSNLTLYMAYADANGYTVVPLVKNDGGYGANVVTNRPASGYDNWRNQVTFADDYIEWAFMGNGGIVSPIIGQEYIWYAW